MTIEQDLRPGNTSVDAAGRTWQISNILVTVAPGEIFRLTSEQFLEGLAGRRRERLIGQHDPTGLVRDQQTFCKCIQRVFHTWWNDLFGIELLQHPTEVQIK